MPTKKRFFKHAKATKQSSDLIKKEKQKEIKVQKQVQEDKKEAKKLQLPKISRFIPDRPTIKIPRRIKIDLQWSMLGTLFGLLLLANYFLIGSFFHAFSSWYHLYQMRQKVAAQMMIWENIASVYPNYRDAYVQGEIYAYELNDSVSEQYFLQRLQLLDPDFPLTKTFQQLEAVQTSVNK